MKRHVPTAILTVLLAALVASPALGADGVKPPRRPFVGTDGLFARAKLGAYCVTYEAADGTGVGQCTASAAPNRPPSARIAVEPGERIVMLFRHREGLRDRPSRLQLSLGRIHDGELETFAAHLQAHRVRGYPRRWRARAPDQVARANFLEIFERFPAGDAGCFVGLRGR